MQKAAVSADNLAPDEGSIVDINGKKVAVYKDKNGKLIKLSPICTHMGCVVGWNKSEKMWNCPCHGAKYDANGKVVQGPATKDLQKLDPAV